MPTKNETQTELLEKPAAKTASIEEIAAPLVNAMPDVTQAAENQNFAPETEATPQAPQSGSVFTDSAGKTFDPAKHASGADGRPKTNSAGRFYAKNIGRPKGQGTGAGNGGGGNGGPIAQPGPASFADIDGNGSTPAGTAMGGFVAPLGPDRFEAAADSYLQLTYALAVLAFSPDVKPDEGEHAALKIPAAQLLRRYDMDDIHPGITFAAVATGIFLKKLEKPTVRERWDNLVNKAKAWITAKFKA